MIELLPDHIANQIAAGEVVQRPASVLKELLENAVDAGATAITIIATDAGRTLLQVIDNGCGMSLTDARMAFERHATSKIHTIDDLNTIATFGFRGEALASIAAVADVEMKTRRTGEEIGTQVIVSASEVTGQEATACAVGTSIAVRNLFFNIPARRRFLKSDSLELKHLVTEMQRVALCHPEVAIRFLHNNTELYNLPVTNLRQRIVNLMGKDLNQQLIDVQVDTSVVRIKGFIGKPERAKRTAGDQYFFVNNRFFKSAYFQKAVTNAYQQLLPDKAYPTFFLYLEIAPDKIDVNIHPAKIEIKFEDEQVIFQMLYAAVREALGKFAVVPPIDFDTAGAPEIPVFRKNSMPVSAPQVDIDPFYNPFAEEKKQVQHAADKTSVKGWEKLYDGMGRSEEFETPNLQSFPSSANDFSETGQEEKAEQLSVENLTPAHSFLQFKGKYILTPIKSGLMIIDRKRAQQRILYEQFLQNIANPNEVQQDIFPQTVTLSPVDYTLLENVLPDLLQAGYDIRPFGKNTMVVNGQPASAPTMDAKDLLDELLHLLHENANDLKTQRQEKLALSLAKAAAGNSTEPMNNFEIQALIDRLFACSEPSFSPDGKPTLQILTTEEINKRFLR